MSADEKNNSMNKDESLKDAQPNDNLVIDYILSKKDKEKAAKKAASDTSNKPEHQSDKENKRTDADDEIDIIDAVKMPEESNQRKGKKIPDDTVKSIKQAEKEITQTISAKTDMLKNNEIVILGLKLMTIAIVMALILSVVNQLTFKRIDQQIQQKKNEAMLKIFSGSEFIEITDLNGIKLNDKVSAVFKVTKDGSPAGYCVNVSSNGFGGAVELIVGVNTNDKVEGVKVISASETPNIGTKALEESYLKNFINLPFPIKFNATTNQGVNAISGATITSTAVKNGINTALEAAAAVKGAGK